MPSTLKQLNEISSCQLKPCYVLGDGCVFPWNTWYSLQDEYPGGQWSFFRGVGRVRKCIHHLTLQVNHVTKRDATLKGQNSELDRCSQEYTQHLPPKSLHLTGAPFLLLFMGGQRGEGAGCSDAIRTDLRRRLDIQIFKRSLTPLNIHTVEQFGSCKSWKS